MEKDPGYAYREGMKYEVLMKRAFGNSNKFNSVTHLGNMEFLILTEEGIKYPRQLPSLEKQLFKIKENLNRGLEKLIKMKEFKSQAGNLSILQSKIEYANSHKDLLEIIEQATMLTQS